MSESQKTQCCERDDDFDGNCDIHSAPGVYRFGSKETDMIYPTMIAAYGRRPTVTVKEAIFFLIDHNSDEPLRPTEISLPGLSHRTHTAKFRMRFQSCWRKMSFC
jgi:hypothetical protein